MSSPYAGKNPKDWSAVTKILIKKHPLSTQEIKEVVLQSWNDIFQSKIGKRGYKIGKDIYPKPQILGFFLHELIPLEFEKRYPKKWRREISAKDKDLICIPDDNFSIEIKTSSNPQSIFGNRSYAQKSLNGKKGKAGYYLAINFEKCTDTCPKPKILKIRFGWLDHKDWMGQKSATGQQSRLSRDVENFKLIEL